jgi:hypothetical protein
MFIGNRRISTRSPVLAADRQYLLTKAWDFLWNIHPEHYLDLADDLRNVKLAIITSYSDGTAE